MIFLGVRRFVNTEINTNNTGHKNNGNLCILTNLFCFPCDCITSARKPTGDRMRCQTCLCSAAPDGEQPHQQQFFSLNRTILVLTTGEAAAGRAADAFAEKAVAPVAACIMFCQQAAGRHRPYHCSFFFSGTRHYGIVEPLFVDLMSSPIPQTP